ncbi:MAG: hypothetical protein JOZ46_09900 [Candidatus Dormibacteraeota bacterium]|nr:hypothetical protein [Candidatus Dormibacteraeota bacterium]MBV9526110.1 hypothetical protein [Candidatus Dormibacteraeota bacterium]
MSRYMVAAACAIPLALFAGAHSAGAAPASGSHENTVRCTGTISPTFNPGMITGTVDNVIVPENNFCVLEGATVRHDVLVEDNAGLGAENSSVGHDVIADEPWEIETGNNGPFTVGHDFVVTGSDLSNGDQGYDICDTTVGHNLVFKHTGVQYEIEIGDVSPPANQEFCEGSPSPPTKVGHDLILEDNLTGRIDVGNNTVGHNLLVKDNTATSANGETLFPGIDVSDNTIHNEAVCDDNTPAPAPDGTEDGPNTAKDNDGC